MQLLQLLECLHHIFAFCKRFCTSAEPFLCFKVLLEIQVTQLAVYLHHIIELLHIELIGLVDIPVILRRHRTHRSPSVLNIAEHRECLVYILLLFQQSLKVLDHSLFQSQILLSLSLKLPVIF